MIKKDSNYVHMTANNVFLLNMRMTGFSIKHIANIMHVFSQRATLVNGISRNHDTPQGELPKAKILKRQQRRR